MAQKWASGGSTKAHTSTAYAKGGKVTAIPEENYAPQRPNPSGMRSESTEYAKASRDSRDADVARREQGARTQANLGCAGFDEELAKDMKRIRSSYATGSDD